MRILGSTSTKNVVILLVAIPPTSVEAPGPADRFRFHFRLPDRNAAELKPVYVESISDHLSFHRLVWDSGQVLMSFLLDKEPLPHYAILTHARARASFPWILV